MGKLSGRVDLTRIIFRKIYLAAYRESLLSFPSVQILPAAARVESHLNPGLPSPC